MKQNHQFEKTWTATMQKTKSIHAILKMCNTDQEVINLKNLCQLFYQLGQKDQAQALEALRDENKRILRGMHR